ncbi:copper resistance protein CopC [Streptomyces sp. NPDC004609]|uniref:copper resistance CopC/CopD family protein n=1 Tax=Streptomyces sp. NPDC004609 TaxID=3364704 RepID=UPI003677A555
MTATAPRLGRYPVRPAHPLVRLLLAAAVLLGTVLGSLLAGAGPAAAHAALTGSNPKDGAVVPTAPKEVTLTFSEQIAMGKDSIRVLEPSGKRADRSAVRDLSADGRVSYAVDLLPGLPNGTYTVAWQAVSADSHPVSGAFTFSIGAPSRTEVALPDQDAGGGLVGFLYDVARYGAYTGFVLMTGGAAFILVCWRRGGSVRPVQRLVAYGWVTLAASTLATLLLRTPYTGSGKLADAFDLGGLQAVLETRTGAALVSRLLLLGAAALFIAVLFGAYAQRDRLRGTDRAEEAEEAGEDRQKDLTFGLAVGGAVVSAGIAATWALSEHASTGIQTGLAMPLDVLHLLAVAGWLGGLTALLTALYRAPSIEPAAVRRFSGMAFACVVALAATGLYQSWRQVGSWPALTGTAYGQLLLAKVALVAVMIGVARISRGWTARLAVAPTTESSGHTGSADGADGDGLAALAEETSGAAENTAGTEGAEDTEGAEAARNEEAERSGAGAPVPADSPPPGPSRPAAPAEPADPVGSGAVATEPREDSVRATQLARQRAAVATARAKKVRDADPVRSGLRRSVLAEAGVAVVVLAVTTVLTATEPGRTEEEAGRAPASSATADAAPTGPTEISVPFDTGGSNGKGTIRLSLDPAAPGANEMHVRVDGTDGKPLDAPEVKVSFTLRAQEIGPLPITPDRVAAGHWSASRVQIPMPGDWQIKVTVRTSDIDQTTIDKNVKIG